TSYGTAALRVKGKFYVRLRNDGESIVLKIGHDAKEVLLQADPEVFFTTDHYNGYPAVLVRLATVRADDLRALLEDAWRLSGPKRLVAAWDDRKACPP
ncbi:MAG TPA: MmcQ/YjbR family DNA-binding protein, partial [Thermoanaerobaculia bacterium]|nr:MmcQ/YjbR family DNA-binding protein [Thermoanaerobaculia bacterium]